MLVRMVLGYLFWFFLGWLAVHRFFLGRVKSALLLLLLSVGSMVLAAQVVWPLLMEFPDAESVDSIDAELLVLKAATSPYFKPAVILSGVVSLWLLADLILVAIMVLKDAEAEEMARQGRPGVNVHAVNMDPSFQAVNRDGDTEEERPRKSALPDDYVMPWRQDNPRGEQKMYRPGEED